MRFRNVLLGGIAIGMLGLGGSGCFPHHHRHHNSCGLEACLLPLACLAPEPVAAAALVTVALLHHDSHRHHRRCGCPSRMYRGQQLYWYGGHWEFYDRGRWYSVPDCPPPY